MAPDGTAEKMWTSQQLRKVNEKERSWGSFPDVHNTMDRAMVIL